TAEITKADLNSLEDGEKKILYMTATRLLEATSRPHLYTAEKIIFECAGKDYIAKGKSMIDAGWKIYEDALRNVFRDSKDTDGTKNADIPDDNADSMDSQKLPHIDEGQVFENVGSDVTEHFTKPPQRYTEATLLSAMEKAGASEMESDVERKGLGTPATRADIIEKLVKDGFIRREKKNLVPTEDGMKLITVLPDKVKSPKLTADWENALSLVAKGELGMDGFMSGIEDMVRGLVKTYHSINDEDKKMFSRGEVLGRCPNCGSDVVKGIYGYYCKNKCGMSLNRIMGISISESQLRNLLAGKKILVKGIRKKNGGTFDAYLEPDGIEEYRYKTANGNEVSGKQFRFNMTFPKRKQ
ncbi:MAG: DNA topoisomerase III, partial [Eubacterium sp.]|nr:DNA topoisomerase III [Eubacterium sp.]